VQTRRAYDNLSLTETPRAGERSAIKLDSTRPTMPQITFQNTTITTSARRLDALRWGAHQHAEFAKADKVKADAIKTVSISYDDGAGDTGTLVLPAAIWDGWMSEMGAKSEGPKPGDGGSSGAMPLPGMGEDAMGMGKAKKADASPSSDSVRIDALERAHAAAERARSVREAAAPYMGGRSLAGLDEVDASLALIGMRTDSAQILPLAQQLGAKVRKAGSLEQQAEARGALGMLFSSSIAELASAPKTDAAPDHDALADLIAGRRGEPKTDAAPVVDSISAARRKRAARLEANHVASLGGKTKAAG
jgi:hypothetical protein